MIHLFVARLRVDKRHVFLLLLCFVSMTRFVSAQSGLGTISLHANQTQVARLAPDALATSVEFQIDECTVLTFDIVSTTANLVTSISVPGGGIYDPSNTEAMGGQFFEFDGSDAPLTANVMPDYGPGFHYIYKIPSQAPGLFSVNLFAPAGISQDEAVVVHCESDSALRANLFSVESVFVLGTPDVIAFALFDGSNPVTGATVTVKVKSPTGDVFVLSLVDNGIDADFAIGDGLYGAQLTPNETGMYQLFAEASGENANEVPFARQAGMEIVAVARCATLDPPPTFSQADTNSNGLFDRLNIEVNVDVAFAATFILQGILTTSSGETLHAYTQQALPVGAGILVASVKAEDIVALAENGPYTLTSLELFCVTEDEGAIPSDRLLGLDLDSPAYLWTEFERPPIRLTDVYDDEAVDVDDDCQMRPDYLAVEIGVIVSQAGNYTAAARLFGPDYELIADGSNSQTNQALNADVPGTLVVWFPAAAIYDKGIDGPYLVRDLIIHGQERFLMQSSMAETQVYDSESFEPYSGVDVIPTGGDGIPDECNCTSNTQCAMEDNDACTFDSCPATAVCSSYPIKYGNVNGDAGQLVNLMDILCVLNGFAVFANCPNADIAPPCTGDNLITLPDILAVQTAFAGTDPCMCQY